MNKLIILICLLVTMIFSFSASICFSAIKSSKLSSPIINREDATKTKKRVMPTSSSASPSPSVSLAPSGKFSDYNPL